MSNQIATTVEPKENKMNDKLSDYDIIDLYKMGFEYTKERHFLSISRISDIRNVVNYVVTGVIAFTGLIISQKEFQVNITQQVILFFFLTAIIVIWLLINWSIPLSTGINTDDFVSLVNNYQNKGLIDLKTELNVDTNSHKVAFYEYLLKRKSAEYQKTSKDIEKAIEKYRKSIIVLTVLFFLFSIFFILNKNFSIHFTF